MRVMVLATLLMDGVALGCSAHQVPRPEPVTARSTIPTGATPPLIGTWRLVEFWDRDSVAAPKRYLYGEKPTGYFVYDPTGHVSIQIQKGPTPPIIANERGEDWFRKALPEELRVTLEAFRGYFRSEE